MAGPRLSNVDVVLNELHRTVVNSGVRMHQAQHMEEVPTGERPGKNSIPRSGSGSSGKSVFGTLKEPS